MTFLGAAQQAQVKGWFVIDPWLPFREAAERILKQFGQKISENALRCWWEKQPELEPAPPPPQKTVELTITVRSGEAV